MTRSRVNASAAVLQRRLSRVVIGMFLLFALIVFAAPRYSFGGAAVALQTSSATPSRSASASPSRSATASASASSTATPRATGPSVQFLNPSAHSTIVSGKNDGTNTTYHLVAWSRAVPSNPLVEFKYQAASSNETTIGNATRVGNTDTFELQWNLGTLADGDYTLKAILYSSGTELARDEIDVVVNTEDDALDPQAETAEITAPANATEFGFYAPSTGGPAIGVVDATSSAAVGPPSASSGTTRVQARYTTSFPGEEPTWKVCGTETKANSADGVKCTLLAADPIANVTAVAVVPNKGPADAPFNDALSGSGDAHRIFPYAQAPTSVSIAPASSSINVGTCVGTITATVLDQNAKKIAGINTDVHAQGPTDNLLFDDSADRSSAHQAPDKAHAGNELAWNCEGSGTAGAQGQHEQAPPAADIKHIETAAAGTSDAGQFRFDLYSPDAGKAQFAVFADDDGDDVWCSAEGSGTGEANWTLGGASGTPAPTPTSGGSTPTPTPTPTPSNSPAGGGPSGPQPETNTCPKPSPTGSQTAGGPDREVTLSTSKRKISAGTVVTFSGRIDSSSQSCTDNELIELRRRVHGTSAFKEFKTTATESDGTYQVVTKVTASADYQATAPGHDECDDATSSALSVLARVKVSARVNDPTPEPGSRVVFRGKVSPAHRGTDVILQRRKGTKWVLVVTDELDRRSRYEIRIEADWGSRDRVFRVKWKKQDPNHEAATSKRIRLNPS